MEWLGSTDAELKESILKLLIKLSKVDDFVNGKELLYLLDIGDMYGFDAEQIRGLLNTDLLDIIVPTDEKDRMTILYLMLFLSKIDGKIKVQEENMIFHYGFKLGFNESLIREMIIVIKEHIGKKLPPDKLISKVKKYLN